jgi:hypothetical protein
VRVRTCSAIRSTSGLEIGSRRPLRRLGSRAKRLHACRASTYAQVRNVESHRKRGSPTHRLSQNVEYTSLASLSRRVIAIR